VQHKKKHFLVRFDKENLLRSSGDEQQYLAMMSQPDYQVNCLDRRRSQEQQHQTMVSQSDYLVI
jgi:hypothetical protein